MPTEAQNIKKVLDLLRKNIGLGETPAGSNKNKIVTWYNKNVDSIGPGPWCEMTNTWAMHTTGAKSLKKGRAYTVYACQDAQKGVNGSSWHWGTKGMKAGDQVYFDWDRHKGDVGYVDHTGTVEKINGDGTFYALEGNTGDKLLRKHRDGTYVVGYVRFKWSEISTKTPAAPSKPSTPAKPSVPEKLVEDGELGPKTISKWQHVMGVPVTGVMSKELVTAVQKKLQSTVDHRQVVDGNVDELRQNGRPSKTIGNVQRYLGSPVDQRWDTPVSKGVKALQRRLNENRF